MLMVMDLVVAEHLLWHVRYLLDIPETIVTVTMQADMNNLIKHGILMAMMMDGVLVAHK